MKAKLLLCLLAITILMACDTGSESATDTNREMATLLEDIRRKSHEYQNPFAPEAQLEYIDSLLSHASNNTERRRSLLFARSYALLQIGEEQQSVTLLEQLLSDAAPFSPAYPELLSLYGLACLRLGERQNCIANHSTESCLMPISGAGVHINKSGSERAVKAYEMLLKIRPEDLESRWMLNIAYMTLGRYPAGVPAAYLLPGLNRDSISSGLRPFTDVAPHLRVDNKNLAGGALVEDFNNDGYLDIITSSMSLYEPMRFFRNEKNGRFLDITRQSGLAQLKGGLNMVQCDYNNDGFTDILVLRGGWLTGRYGQQPMSLLRNNGNETFTDVTLKAGLFVLHPTQTAVWRDFNNDGWLDLFVGNETERNDRNEYPCELFLNNKRGGFTEVAAAAGCNISAFVKGVTAADYNNDGLQDIFLSSTSGRQILLRNTGIRNGVPLFTETAYLTEKPAKVNSFPAWFWDYDNDGWQDIFVGGYQPGNSMAGTIAAEILNRRDATASTTYLYHNNRNGSFTDVSRQAGLNTSVFAMGSNFGDIDNDGWLDMYLGTGNPLFSSLMPNKMFRNMDGKKFADVTVATRLGNLQKGHAVCFADMDNDGDQDIFIEVGGAYRGDAYNNSLYLNPGQNNNHWLNISLQGTRSNRAAIGSVIRVRFTENGVQRYVYRQVSNGGSFGGSPLRSEIGMGQASMADEIAITWAGSNHTQVFRNIRADQFIRIVEDRNTVETIPVKPLPFTQGMDTALFCAPAVASVHR